MISESGNIPLFSTAFLPPIGYLALMAHFRHVMIEAEENYVKQSYRNRVRFIGDQGVRDISIPILHASGQKIPIREALTDEHLPWRRNLWRAVQAAYNRSPFFLYYSDGLKQQILDGSQQLFELNSNCLTWLTNALKLEVAADLTREYKKEYQRDYRQRFHPKVQADPAPAYWQTFSDRQAFVGGLSGIDILFNLGPEAREYLLDYGRLLAHHSG